MLKIKYRKNDEEDLIFVTNEEWILNDPKAIAEAIAKDEYSQSGENLYDPWWWPRNYEIQISDEWVKVSVEIEYFPYFSASVNKPQTTTADLQIDKEAIEWMSKVSDEALLSFSQSNSKD